MNAEQLLHHFDQIADAPDAVARLRQFILDLAVRGKLVEQNPSEGTGGELLEHLRKVKSQLMTERGIRREKDIEYATLQTEVELPSTWIWVYVDDIAIIQGGKRLPAGAAFSKVQTPHVYIRVTDMKNGTIIADDLVYIAPEVKHAIARYTINKEDLYITIAGTIGQVGRVPPAFDGHNLTENAAKIVFRLLNPEFLRLVLSANILQQQFQEKTKQMAQPKLALKRIAGAKLPLPPLAEQHRIVAKVDELMALCDELEAARAQRETRRDQLVAATLHGLVNDPVGHVSGVTHDSGATNGFAERARFYFNHLPRLTTRPEHIKQLRQTILNLAVRGKLVPQDPNDEPASELLKRIQEKTAIPTLHRSSVMKDSQLAREGGEPFDIPPNWPWVQFHLLFEVSGGIQKTPHRTPGNNAFPYLGVGNVYRGSLDLSTVKQFELKDGELNRWRLEAGDLLIIEGNGSLTEIGRCALWNGEIENCVHQNHVIRCRPIISAISLFALKFLNSPTGIDLMQRLAITSSGLYSLSVGKIRGITIPLPPLAEQHRIVAKVDELMALCDALETQLTTNAATRRQLLEATLHNVLSRSHSTVSPQHTEALP